MPVQCVCDADLIWAEEQLMRVLHVQRGDKRSFNARDLPVEEEFPIPG
jgi:hypothetical protein